MAGFLEVHSDEGTQRFGLKDPTPRVDCSHGAPMGRATSTDQRTFAADKGPFRLVRCPLDSGGYDRGGAYWGLGAPLYFFEGPSGASGYVRGRTREAAKREVRQHCPIATFFR